MNFDGFLKPDYENAGLVRIPDTVRHLFGAGPETALARACPDAKPRAVVLLLVDGFGWEHWKRYAPKYDFYRRVEERGQVVPITSCFPASTAPNITAIHTGLPPAAHGLPEWWTYFDEIDAVLETLPFRVADGPADALRDADPAMLVSAPTVYASFGVPCTLLQRQEYATSTYSRLIGRGARFAGYSGMADFVRQVRELAAGGGFTYAYWDLIDAAAHTYGPDSPEHVAEIERFAGGMKHIAGVDATLIITADHGHINMDPDQTRYLNTRPEIVECLAPRPRGGHVPPWGIPRTMFLRAKPGMTATLVERLRAFVGDIAEVATSDEAIREGLFGGPPPDKFRRRFGDAVVLCRGRHTVWTEYSNGRKLRLKGIHGGMTPEEMRVPFAAVDLAKL